MAIIMDLHPSANVNVYGCVNGHKRYLEGRRGLGRTSDIEICLSDIKVSPTDYDEGVNNFGMWLYRQWIRLPRLMLLPRDWEIVWIRQRDPEEFGDVYCVGGAIFSWPILLSKPFFGATQIGRHRNTQRKGATRLWPPISKKLKT
jgi:hypothetical protein